METARRVAAEAAVAAGRLARERFDQEKRIAPKDEHGDLLTEVDTQAEAIILERLRQAFPEHPIRSEESGWSGPERDGEWLWLVDPLDGTNNYAIGLPVYGVSITLIHRGEPVLGVICDSPQEKLYIAERGRGAVCDGRPIAMREPARPERPTLGWIQGHQVQRDPRAVRLKHALEAVAKRIVTLWAPTIQWAMTARGDLDGIVLYNSEGDDLYAGVLLAREAGCVVMDYEGRPFTGMCSEPYLIACHPGQRERMLRWVQEGLSLEGSEGP